MLGTTLNNIKPRPEGPTSKQNNSQSHCGRCGRSPNHPLIKCPARDALCHQYKKKGHFKDMCRSKRMNEVYEEEEEQGQHDDEFDRGFLGSISRHELESQGDP